MTSFLITKKDNKSYEEKLSSAPESTKRNKVYAVQVFERFCQEKYEKYSEEIIKEIIKIKQDQSEEYENALYGMLQEWINWNKFSFTKSTGFKVTFDGKDFLVYVNMDNEFLKQEIEEESEPEFLTNLYKSAMAMIAFGIYHKLDSKENARKQENKSEHDTMSISDKAADASEGIAMVLLPIITKLGAEARQIQKLET